MTEIKIIQVKRIKTKESPSSQVLGKIDKVHVQYLAISIARFGILEPLLLDQDHSLISGRHRLAAAKSLDIKEVPCLIKEMDLSESKLACIHCNYTQGKASNEDLLEAIKNTEDPQESLLSLGLFLGLAEVKDEVYTPNRKIMELVRSGKLTNSQASLLYKLPRELLTLIIQKFYVHSLSEEIIDDLSNGVTLEHSK